MTLRPPRLLPLVAALLVPALAACAPPSEEGAAPLQSPGLFGPREPEAPPAPEPLPAAVLAALPPGVPPSVVLEDGNGCYLYSIERTDPPSGYPLRDAAGNPVCEGGVVASGAIPGAPIETVAGLAADVALAAGPVPPAPVVDGGPIDITPVLTAPLPASAGPSTPAPGALPALGPAIATPSIVPGSITPPAPLAPLN